MLSKLEKVEKVPYHKFFGHFCVFFKSMSQKMAKMAMLTKDKNHNIICYWIS
jgi:hypothetical protein